MDDLHYLAVAFAFAWVVVFGYVVVLSVKQRQLRQQLNALHERMENRD